MALSEADVRRLARDLWDAEQASVAIAPIGSRCPEADIDDAYRIQLEGVRLRGAAGDTVGSTGLAARRCWNLVDGGPRSLRLAAWVACAFMVLGLLVAVQVLVDLAV